MERAQRGSAIPQRVFLCGREHMPALYTGEIATCVILLEDEIATAMWAGFQQEHGGSPFILRQLVRLRARGGFPQRADASVASDAPRMAR